MATKKGVQDYSAGLSELEKIVQSLEDESLDLDAMLVAVERGLVLAEDLQKYLDAADNKVQQLQKKYRVEVDDDAA